jgi:hypothetical protein
VIICFASGALAREGSHDAACERHARGWLHTHNLPVDEDTVRYRAAGWRYVRADGKNVTVFWVRPARQTM